MSFKGSATLPANRYVEALAFKQTTHNGVLHFIIIHEQNLDSRDRSFHGELDGFSCLGRSHRRLNGLYGFRARALSGAPRAFQLEPSAGGPST
jgi:hypothetical protein